MMKRDWSSLSTEQMMFYRELCPDNEYRVLKLDFDLPGVSKGLTDQCPLILVAASGDASGRVYVMANLHRPDPKDPKGNAIDQMPFGFVFDNDSPMLSGVLIQHGNWENRTTYPPASAWDDVVDGVFQKYVEAGVVTSLSAGSIYGLEGTSQQGAFSTMIDGLSAKAAERVRQHQASGGTFAPPTTIAIGTDEPEGIEVTRSLDDSLK